MLAAKDGVLAWSFHRKQTVAEEIGYRISKTFWSLHTRGRIASWPKEEVSPYELVFSLGEYEFKYQRQQFSAVHLRLNFSLAGKNKQTMKYCLRLKSLIDQQLDVNEGK